MLKASSLLESVVSITIITIVLAVVGTVFSNMFSGQKTATQIEMEYSMDSVVTGINADRIQFKELFVEKNNYSLSGKKEGLSESLYRATIIIEYNGKILKQEELILREEK